MPNAAGLLQGAPARTPNAAVHDVKGAEDIAVFSRWGLRQAARSGVSAGIATCCAAAQQRGSTSTAVAPDNRNGACRARH